MFVSQHAQQRIAARIGWRLADPIITRLEAMAGEPGNVAYEVHRLAAPGTLTIDGSNGDQVVVIARDGSVETVMLRRSWNQPFTPAALSVHRCTRLLV